MSTGQLSISMKSLQYFLKYLGGAFDLYLPTGTYLQELNDICPLLIWAVVLSLQCIPQIDEVHHNIWHSQLSFAALFGYDFSEQPHIFASERNINKIHH